MSWNLDNPVPGDIVFIFDVDGTLTPARKSIAPEFCKFFEEWITGKEVYLASGSDMSKLREQLPEGILHGVKGVYASCGNEYYVKDNIFYKNVFEPPRELVLMLNDHINNKSEYQKRYGNHIEHRSGMLNFSVVGRNAPDKERLKYYKWDCAAKEREALARQIESVFPDIEATVGGQISIDIYPKGKDKSQILKDLNYNRYVFFGDKQQPGGNDHSLAMAIRKKNRFETHNVKGYKDTWKTLKGLYLGKICENENCGGCGCVEYQ